MAEHVPDDTIEVRIMDEQSDKQLLTFYNISNHRTVLDVKQRLQDTYDHFIIPRQRYRSKSGKRIDDDQILNTLPQIQGCVELYFRDLGPQVSWRGVYIVEYIGPIVIYLMFYLMPFLFYSSNKNTRLYESHLSCLMWTFHYTKRLLESIFVHQFSRSTMPLGNLFKNCAYYWGFTAWIGYLLNHPLYSGASSTTQVWIGLIIFIVAEYGNAQCHLLFSNMRPKDVQDSSTIRKIPFPNNNYMTNLFNYVSCPNYTYEVLAWIGFSMVCQCLAAMIFAVIGSLQMASWAQSKLRRYKKEFPEYPAQRKAIMPFIY